jgi:hypothetical protein
MDILKNYKKRVLLGENNAKDKLELQARRSFEKMLEVSPAAKRVKATRPFQIDIIGNEREIDCIIQNITDNDIKAFDQKYIEVRYDEDFDIGCYIEYDGTYWLAIFREHKTLETNKKFTLAKCNNIWRYKYKGKLYEFPIYAQNLSLYSDGLADNQYTSQEDGKVSIYVGENAITKGIDINTRIIFENRSVFRMTNINDYEFKSKPDGSCAIKAILLQTTLVKGDDVVNNIAWNENCEFDLLDAGESCEVEILGKDNVMIGSYQTYVLANCDELVMWGLNCEHKLKSKLNATFNKNIMEIGFLVGVEFVGQEVELQAYVGVDLVATKKVTLVGL